MKAVRQRLGVELFANRDGQFCAFGLRPGPQLAEGLEPLAEGLAALTAARPCFVSEAPETDWGPALDTLTAAGVRPVPAARIARPAGAEALSGLDADLVAGDWYLQPLAQPIRDPAGSRALALKLLQLVVAEAETREIEEIFRREPTLSYHLLRLVNSPGIGTGRRIDSFAQAILVLGRRQLRRWLNLLLFTARKEDPRSALLLARVSVRARLLELLVRAQGEDREHQEHAFMAGMFSLLGVTFGMPLESVLAPLKLDAALLAALLRREGELGALLAAVEAAESGDATTVQALLGPRLPADLDFDALQLEACAWMAALVGSGEGGHG